MNDKVFVEMARKLEQLEAEQRRLASLGAQYQMLNQAVAQNLTSDQNNLALGDYDMLFLIPTAARIVRGITGGVKGRMLWILNRGTFNLTFTHQDAAATAENRISTATAGNIVIGLRQTALFTYVNDAAVTTGATRWLLLFPVA